MVIDELMVWSLRMARRRYVTLVESHVSMQARGDRTLTTRFCENLRALVSGHHCDTLGQHRAAQTHIPRSWSPRATRLYDTRAVIVVLSTTVTELATGAGPDPLSRPTDTPGKNPVPLVVTLVLAPGATLLGAIPSNPRPNKRPLVGHRADRSGNSPRGQASCKNSTHALTHNFI